MLKRLFKLLAILTPLAVFASLQFSGPRGEPISSVLDPLLPAKAAAADCNHSICATLQGHYYCQSFQWMTCEVNFSGTVCNDAPC